MIRPADIADPRLTPAGPGLADQALEGVLRAPVYAVSRQMRAAAPALDVLDADDALVSQLLWGELFTVSEVRDGFAFGRAARDGRVGWVRAGGLDQGGPAPTHRVARLDAPLPLNALVAVEQIADGQARVEGFGWLPVEALADFHAFQSDPAAVAEAFLGAPWRAGGRTTDGIDAPGLVQQALFACALACPRHADQQARELGAPAGAGTDCRADLVFWPDHAAILLDSGRMIHASPQAGAVVIEPLTVVEGRLGPAERRRLTAFA